jgi:2-C-methyl-D-erythritol 4-phosphate cytidylyltransferase
VQPKQVVIIVAGGIGSRIKSDRPKQFIEINGEPVIIKTIRCFLSYDPEISIIISVHRNYNTYLDGLLEKYSMKSNNIRVTFGGETRFASVKNGLSLVDDETAIVGIHDAARPFVSAQTIRVCYETAAQKGNAVPCILVNDSLRKISNNVNSSINRNEYRIIQTPQCFQVALIRKAFMQEYSPAFTDDATVAEASGANIFLVEGNEENFKITSPFDLLVAKAIVNNE